MSKQKKGKTDNTIALNRKAFHDFSIEQKFEAGLVLRGWEIKSIRQGRINLKESYVLMKSGEAWLFGAHITPLTSASTHVKADPTRTRKLLLNASEIKKLLGSTQEKGYAIVPLALFWKKQLVKVQIGLGTGKKLHDKRATEKERDWAREKHRILKA
jgi:SsrA-binding protein